MAQLRVRNFSISLDGFVAGPRQDPEHPLGVGGEALHEWVFATRFGRAMMGEEGGTTGIDDGFAQRMHEGIGATVMGRNMFGPVRGPWPADGEPWTGWWGDEPPYHHEVFVLTHHARASVPMTGGTTFHFVTDGPESALAQAFTAADGGDVVLGGGAATVREYLRVGLVDSLHLAMSPVLLGDGERLFDGVDAAAAGYSCTELVPGERVVHAVLIRNE